MKKILLVTYETRFARCGGITAVMNYLPGQLMAMAGLSTCVITPFHHRIASTRSLPARLVDTVEVPFYDDRVPVKIYRYDDRWDWYFLDAQDYRIPWAPPGVSSEEREKEQRFFSGRRHPYDVGAAAQDQGIILTRDALFFGAAVAASLPKISPDTLWTLMMQDWQAATAALALTGVNGDCVGKLFLTLHNSYDSGPVHEDALRGFGINPSYVRGRGDLSTVLTRALPLVEKPLFTVSEQFANDLTRDILQCRVMADHLQAPFNEYKVVGVNNGPFASLAVPAKPELEMLRKKPRHELGAFKDWNGERKRPRPITYGALKRWKAEQRRSRPDNFSLGEWKEAQKRKAVAALYGELKVRENDTQQGKKLAEERPVWGSLAEFLDAAKPRRNTEAIWFVMAGRDDTRQKGYDVASEAVRRFLGEESNRKSAQFLFFPIPGDEDREGLIFLKDLAEEFKANVLVMPFIFQEGFLSALRGAAYGIMPSLYEPFGMANEFYLNGAVGIGRATGGLLQQIVPLRKIGDSSLPSFTEAAEKLADSWYGPSAPPAGLLYREPDGDPDRVEADWRAFNNVGYLARADRNRVEERKNLQLFNDMVEALRQAIIDAVEIHRLPADGKGRQPYYSMLIEGISHIQRSFSWEQSAARYISSMA